MGHDAPSWRDSVVLALLERDARAQDLPAANAWRAQLQTTEARDQARATLARAFAASLPEQASAELDGIADDSLRARVARALQTEPAMLATPDALFALVLALQSDPNDLGALLRSLVEAHPHSALVDALARSLGLEQPATEGGTFVDPLPEILAHPAWRDEVAGKRWEAFGARLPDTRALIAEAVSARATVAGLVDAETAAALAARVAAPTSTHPAQVSTP